VKWYKLWVYSAASIVLLIINDLQHVWTVQPPGGYIYDMIRKQSSESIGVLLLFPYGGKQSKAYGLNNQHHRGALAKERRNGIWIDKMKQYLRNSSMA